MSWWETLPVVFIMAGVFFVPGLLVGALARLRGITLLAAAPAISLGIGGVSAVVGGLVGIPWGIATYCVATTLTALAAWALCRKTPVQTVPSTHRYSWIATTAGLVTAAFISIPPLRLGMGEPHFPALTWDAVHHLSTIRWILESGDGSSLTVGGIASDERVPRFYPAAWHDLVSLAVTDLPISLSINVAALMMAGLIWPLAVAYLARVCFPQSAWIGFIAPVLASGFVAFPARMISYGTVWPAAMGTAITPVLIGLVVQLLGRPDHRARLGSSIALLIAGAGAVLCHPTAAVAMAFLVLPFLLSRYVPFLRTAIRQRSLFSVSVALLVPLSVLALTIWAIHAVPAVRAVFNFRTTPVGPGTDAFGAAVFDTMLAPLGHGNTEPFWIGGLLVIVGGLVAIARRESRWIVASYAISVALYVIAAGEPSFLSPLVGLWYSDPVRLGGLVPIFASVLGAYAIHVGVSSLGGAAVGKMRGQVSHRLRQVISFGLAVLSVFLVFLFSESMRADVREDRIAADYWEHREWADGLASDAELEMLLSLEDRLPEDALLLGDPTSGAALAYALGDVEAVFPTMAGSWSQEARYLGRNFYQLESDPRVCRIINEMGITHVYDDDGRYLADIVHRKDMKGLTVRGLSPDSVRLITSADGAAVYAITGC
ncbi:DUF6541 family protein [Arthrobacter pigmenti]|nr:DUF6541 family protein [Arthrobacter pigmenti]